MLLNDGFLDSTNRTLKELVLEEALWHKAAEQLASEPFQKNTLDDSGYCFRRARVLIQRIHLVKKGPKDDQRQPFLMQFCVHDPKVTVPEETMHLGRRQGRTPWKPFGSSILSS